MGPELGGPGVDKKGVYLESWSVERDDEQRMLFEVEEAGEEVEGEPEVLPASLGLRQEPGGWGA